VGEKRVAGLDGVVDARDGWKERDKNDDRTI